MSELWKEVNGYEGYYKINRSGHIKSLDREISSINKGNGRMRSFLKGKTMKPAESHNGYLTASFCRNGRKTRKRVHRLVAEHFIPNPENKPQVNHIDADKKNNHVSNLEWVTRGENEAHALEHGLKPSGERCGKSKLKLKEVKLIRQRYKKEEISMKKLGDEHGVTVQAISAIINRKTWCTE